MNEQPRTNEQRSADSRSRILDAAVACLVEGGYSAATTLRIQARAGVSRGRLLHHFPSRDLLLVAAAQHLAARRVQGPDPHAAAVLEEAGTGPDRLDRVVELMWKSFHEPHYWAATELWVAARTNPDLANALLPEERRLGASVRAAVDRMFGPPWTAKPRYPELRELLLTSMRGAALTYAFDQRDPADDPHVAQWKAATRLYLDVRES